MRKIEKQMLNAIKSGKDFKCDNTQVLSMPDGFCVWLHGNQIAIGGTNYIQITLAGWPTTTTRSRLHALCVAFTKSRGIGQSKGKQFLDLPTGKIEVNAKDWYSIERVSGGFHS